MANSVLNIDVANIVNGAYLMMGNTNLVEWSWLPFKEMNKLDNGYAMFANCSNLETFYDSLSNLSNGSRMFYKCSKLHSFNGDLLSKLDDGRYMFSNCTALNSFGGDLINLTKGQSMFYNCTNLKSFNGDLSNITEVRDMFCNCTALSTFNSNLSKLNDGSYMFSNCRTLNSFTVDLPVLTTGIEMFSNCISLSAFNSNLSNLTDGVMMFYNCTKLNSFNIYQNDLNKLENGYGMFAGCNNLTSFNSNLSNLTDGNAMFSSSSLISFSGDLSSLVNGREMFKSTSLTSFNGDSSGSPVNLSSLVDGSYMFCNCYKLNSFNIYQNDLNKLENGYYMFGECSSLTSFYNEMSSLTIGENMFTRCTNLKTFGGDLSNLTNGQNMFFGCTNLGSFNDYGSLSQIDNCFCMFSGTKYLYSVIADLSGLEDGNSMFVNAGSRLFTDNKYEMRNRGLTDDGLPDGESAVYFQIGSLSSLKYGYMMFASTETYDYGSENSPYQFSPFALCILNRPSEMNPIHFERDGVGVGDGATCMFDGRLIVGSKTLEYIHSIMYYNTSPTQQNFGRIGMGGSIDYPTPCIQYLKNNFTYLSSSPTNPIYERWYITNMIGNKMYIDVLFQ